MSCWLSTELADELLAIYNANYQSEYRVEHEDIAKRTLRNACLRFLAFGETHLADVLVSKQFHEANNMTDALAALSAAVGGTTAQLRLLHNCHAVTR